MYFLTITQVFTSVRFFSLFPEGFQTRLLDSNSGKFPLDFVSFCLEITTEARETENAMSENEPEEGADTAG